MIGLLKRALICVRSGSGAPGLAPRPGRQAGGLVPQFRRHVHDAGGIRFTIRGVPVLAGVTVALARARAGVRLRFRGVGGVGSAGGAGFGVSGVASSLGGWSSGCSRSGASSGFSGRSGTFEYRAGVRSSDSASFASGLVFSAVTVSMRSASGVGVVGDRGSASLGGRSSEAKVLRRGSPPAASAVPWSA